MAIISGEGNGGALGLVSMAGGNKYRRGLGIGLLCPDLLDNSSDDFTVTKEAPRK